MYPAFLQPTSNELFTSNSQQIEIPKCIAAFQKWNGDPVKETFGGKAMVYFDNKPMFAELAILNSFVKEGWEARWVSTYGRGRKEPVCLAGWTDDEYKNQKHVPVSDQKVSDLLSQIAATNGGTYAGCWDILAWKNDDIIFAESKRSNKDSIRQSQTNWLNAALEQGVKPINFLVVQWDFG